MFQFVRQSYRLSTKHRCLSSPILCNYFTACRSDGCIKLEQTSLSLHTNSFGAIHHQRHLYNNESKNNTLPSDQNDNDLEVTQLNDGIVKVSFNRPQKANSMGKAMLSQLQDIIVDLNSKEGGKNVRCIILSSCSDRVFSAGADFKERSKMTMEEASSFVTALRSALNDLAELPMPMIACVEVRIFF